MPWIRPEPPSSAHQDKLYVVTRDDLSVGYQITQAVHAVADWHRDRPVAASVWSEISNSVVVLAVPAARQLHELAATARDRGVEAVSFREPDLGDELTALAFTPGRDTRRLLANLRLAGRRVADQEPLLAREKALRELSFSMMDCEQARGQDVLAHGRSVREHYFALLDHLAGRVDLRTAPNWRMPAWVDEHAAALAAATLPTHQMDTYLTLHDAGKPSVRTVDGAGRVHFPGHAQASARVYREVESAGGGQPDLTVLDLIAGDMDIHLLRAEGLTEFAARPTAVAHLLAGLAEVTSNAAMFGGTDSVSFKIKLKHLDKRGRALCRILFDEEAGR